MGPPLRLRRSGVVIVRVRLVRAPTLTRNLRADQHHGDVARKPPGFAWWMGLATVSSAGRWRRRWRGRHHRSTRPRSTRPGPPPSGPCHGSALAVAGHPGYSFSIRCHVAAAPIGTGNKGVETSPLPCAASAPRGSIQLGRCHTAMSVPVGLHLPARIFLSAAAIACAALRLSVKSSP